MATGRDGQVVAICLSNMLNELYCMENEDRDRLVVILETAAKATYSEDNPKDRAVAYQPVRYGDKRIARALNNLAHAVSKMND